MLCRQSSVVLNAWKYNWRPLWRNINFLSRKKKLLGFKKTTSLFFVFRWGCRDLEGTARDYQGVDCKWYKDNSNDCGKWDTDDFKAYEMCCGCEGGSANGTAGNATTGNHIIFFFDSFYDNPGEIHYFFSGGGKIRSIFHPPPPNMSKFLRIFSLPTQKCFWWNKSNFVVQKKKDFDGKPKMTKFSGFENFEIVKMGQKGFFWKKPVWGQKRLQILLWCDFLFSFFYVLNDFLYRQRPKEVTTIRLNKTKCIFHGFRQLFKTKWFYWSPFNRWISPGLS